MLSTTRTHRIENILLVCLMMWAATAHSQEAAPSPAAASSDKPTIYVGTKASYTDESMIDRGVLGCNLPEREIKVLTDAAAKRGYKIVSDDAAVAAGKGRILKVNLADAVSQGNAFIGHHKVVKIRGTLLDNGKEIGSFGGTRSSRGGAFAGYKGSCTVLERCVDALAEDVAAWLDKPSEKRIGE